MNTELTIGVITGNKAPITLAEAVYIGDGTTKTVKDVLSEGGTSSSIKHNFALTGSIKFTINFTDKTITHSTWVLCTNTGLFNSINLSSITIPDEVISASTSNSKMYYLIVNSSGYKIVSASNLSSDSGGNIVCGICGTTVYPMLYPVDNLYVVGGSMYGNTYKSIGKVTNLGDSITFAGCMSGLDIPITNKLAVNGATIIGNSITSQADHVTEDTDLITILGGTNDEKAIVSNGKYIDSKVGTLQPIGSTFDKTTFFGAYQYIIETCYSKNSKVKIILCTPPRAWEQSEPYNERTSLKLVGDLVKQIGKFYSIPVLDLWNECPINEITRDVYLTDKLHPNSVGCGLISRLVKSAIKYYYCGQ